MARRPAASAARRAGTPNQTSLLLHLVQLQAEEARQQTIDMLVGMVTQDNVQEERQEIDYNPYEDVPVLLRPECWENVKATRLETNEEMQERIENQRARNYTDVKIGKDGTIIASRAIKTGEAVWNGGDLTNSDGYSAAYETQTVTIRPPQAIKLASGGDLFASWDYDELQESHEENLSDFYAGLDRKVQAAQGQLANANELFTARETAFQQNAASQAQTWSMIKSLVTSMMGGMDLGSALVDYAKNQIIGQVASQIETMTGIPAGFMSSILGGANIEQAMQSYAWQVVGSHIDEVTGISGLGSQLTGMLQKQMAKKAARNGPMGKLANSMAAMTMGGGFGAMAGFMMGGPMGMLAGAAMGAATGGAMNEAGAAGFAAPMADVFYENPMLMDATAYATASATGNPGVWYGYQAMKGSYMGGTVGALTSMADSALMATQLVGVDASISYTFDDGFGGSLGFGGEYGSVGVSYSERDGMGAYGRLGSGDGLSIGFNVSEHGGNSINAGYSSGGVNLGVSYSDQTGFGANAGFGGEIADGLNGNLGLSWSETEGVGANAGLTYGNSDLGNAMGAGLSYTQNSGLSANVSLAGATLASIAQGGNLQFNSNFASDAGRGVLKEEYVKQRKEERLDGLEEALDDAGELTEEEKQFLKENPGKRQAFLEKKAAEIKDRVEKLGDKSSEADDYGSSWDNQGGLTGLLSSFDLGKDILNFANEITGTNSDNTGFVDSEGKFHVRTCFVAGTLVRVRKDAPGAFEEGGEWFKKIEDVGVGDHVLSWDEKSGAVSFQPVTELFRHDVELIFEIAYVDGTIIETTWNHPFFVPDVGWVEARHLRGGDRSLSAAGEMLVIASVREMRREARVFNFEVKRNHTYFVGPAGVLVHNYDLRTGTVDEERDLKEVLAKVNEELGLDYTLEELADLNGIEPQGHCLTYASVTCDYPIVEGQQILTEEQYKDLSEDERTSFFDNPKNPKETGVYQVTLSAGAMFFSGHYWDIGFVDETTHIGRFTQSRGLPIQSYTRTIGEGGDITAGMTIQMVENTTIEDFVFGNELFMTSEVDGGLPFWNPGLIMRANNSYAGWLANFGLTPGLGVAVSSNQTPDLAGNTTAPLGTGWWPGGPATISTEHCILSTSQKTGPISVDCL